MKLTEKIVKNNERAQSSPRVHPAQTLNSNKPITRSMFKDIPQVPRVPLTAVPRVDRMTRIEPQNFPPHNQMLEKHKARRRQHTQTIPTVSNNAPARNTLSQTRTITTAASGTRPITRSSKLMSKLVRTMPAKRKKTTRTETAAAVEERRKKQTHKTDDTKNQQLINISTSGHGGNG